MSFFGLTSLGPESLIKATLVNAGCKKIYKKKIKKKIRFQFIFR